MAAFETLKPASVATRFAIAQRRQVVITPVKGIGDAGKQGAGGLELGVHVGQLKEKSLLADQRAAKRGARLEVRNRLLERGLATAERAGTRVDPTAVQPTHRVSETVTLRAEQVTRRHSNPVEEDLAPRLRVPAPPFSSRPQVSPGVPSGTTMALMPLFPVSAARAITM